MDRFIVRRHSLPQTRWYYLKSSMDRFIGRHLVHETASQADLKSSMDRFIEYGYEWKQIAQKVFKIQYG